MKALFDGVYQKRTVVIRTTNKMEANYPVEPMGTQRRYKNSLKRGKTRATKSRLLLVWKPSGREKR